MIVKVLIVKSVLTTLVCISNLCKVFSNASTLYSVSSSQVGPVRGSNARSQPLKTCSILVICDTIIKMIIMAYGENLYFY